MLAVRVTSMGFCDSKKVGAGTSFTGSDVLVGWARSALVGRRAKKRKNLVNAFVTDTGRERGVSVAIRLSRERALEYHATGRFTP
jgi:hypothetical protein